MTKNEIIEKTLKEIGPRLEEHEEPYSEDPDWEEIVIAELQKRLAGKDIKTCEDFRHLNVACCDTCHTFYPHYEMSLIELPDGAQAWVCDPVKWAIYPEQYQQTPRVEAELHRGQSAQACLWRGRRQIDHSLFRCGAAGKGFKKGRGQDMQIGEPLRIIVVEPLELPVNQPAGEPEPVPVSEPQPEQEPIVQ